MNKFNLILCLSVLSHFVQAQQVQVQQLQEISEFVPCEVMPNIIVNYDADYNSLAIAYIVENAPERRARFEKLYNDYLAKLNKVDFNSLPQECKVDYTLFKRDMNENLRLSGIQAKESEKVKQWFPFADKIYELEQTRRKGTMPDAKKVALDLDEIKKQIDKLQSDLKADKNLNILSIYTADETITGLKTALKSTYDFYNGYDPMFSWWVPMPYERLDKALTSYATEFKNKLKDPAFQQDNSGIVGKPVGKDELVRLLNYNYIPYSPEELIEIANKEFAWCDKEMLKASNEMKFGNDWKAALEKVKNTYVEPGKQPEAILKLFNESMVFIKKNDLVTIDPLAEEVWGLRMMSPERQLVNPFFTGGTSISISYPTNTMEVTDRMMSMRGNNPHFSRATVHHESIAGHHYQRFMTNRNRVYRQFDTPFWSEGNALYWEFLLYDMKFPESPEDRIGMLFWRMHRCARVIFSLNYHLGKWTPQQSIDFLVDRVGHERANAEGEVRRSFELRISPLYQLAYMMGGLQFYALKKELVDNGQMTLKEYHDTILQLNSMPIEMVRAILIKQKLEKDFKTKWKFYKDL